MVNLGRPNTLIAPEPFKAKKTASPPETVVRPPEDDQIIFQRPFTTIIIRAGNQLPKSCTCLHPSVICPHCPLFDADPDLLVVLTVPDTVREGEMFLPLLTVSQEVLATFSLRSLSGTATQNFDFAFYAVEVEFARTNFTLAAPSSVSTLADNLVEPSETVIIQVGLSTPSSIRNSVVFINQMESVTILDNNSECACHFMARYVDKSSRTWLYRHLFY